MGQLHAVTLDTVDLQQSRYHTFLYSSSGQTFLWKCGYLTVD